MAADAVFPPPPPSIGSAFLPASQSNGITQKKNHPKPNKSTPQNPIPFSVNKKPIIYTQWQKSLSLKYVSGDEPRKVKTLSAWKAATNFTT